MSVPFSNSAIVAGTIRSLSQSKSRGIGEGTGVGESLLSQYGDGVWARARKGVPGSNGGMKAGGGVGSGSAGAQNRLRRGRKLVAGREAYSKGEARLGDDLEDRRLEFTEEVDGEVPRDEVEIEAV